MRRLVALVTLLVTVVVAGTLPVVAQQVPSQPTNPNGPVQQALPCYEDCGGGGPDELAPTIYLTGDPLTVTVPAPVLTMNWCDNASLASSTRWVTVNGVDQTSAFSDWQSGVGICDEIVRARSVSTPITLNAGNNTVVAGICDNADNCTTQTFTVAYNNQPAPILSLAPHSPDLLDYARCAMACFATTHAQSTVPYFTLNTPRSATLIFNSDAADPRPAVHLNVTHAGDDNNLPAQGYRLQLKKADQSLVTFVNGETTLRFTATTAATVRLSGQFRASQNGMTTTGAYPLTVLVGADYGSTIVWTSAATRVLVVNESNAAIARGWMTAGFQRAYAQADGSLVITEGDGSATYFQKSGSAFVSPAGDLTRVTANAGTGWTRAYPDSTKVVFTSGGLVYSATDRFGNATTYLWDGSLRPWRIQDPTHSQFNQRQTTFVYDANGLDYIQDAFGRVTQVTVNASRNLTAISDPDAVSTQFAYSTGRLTSVTNRLGATTTLAYDTLTGRLDTIIAPAVSVFGGGTDTPRIFNAPWQSLAVPRTLTASAPFTSVLASAVQATVTDPGGHAAAFTVNAFGQPLRTAGLLGDTVTVTYNTRSQPTQVVDRLSVTSNFTYDANGFAMQSTVAGVVMHYRNGAWGQADSVWGNGPSRRLFLNPGNGRLDSVRVGGKGQADSLQTKVRYTYDSRGRVVLARDNTRDTATAPYHLLEQHWYNGAEGNLSKDSLPTGATVTYGYDGYGRPTTVTRTGLPTQTVEYDAVNRVIRSWDGVNANPTRYFYGAQVQDGLITDSLKDPAGNVYRSARNAAGWVVRQTDPGGRVDSVQYDAEGLARRAFNRRGQVTELTYDALHRMLRRTGAGNDSARFAYSTDGRQVTDSSAAAIHTTFLSALQRVDSVRTWLTGVAQPYVHRFRHNAEGRLDSTWVTGPWASQRRGYRWRPNVGVLDTLWFAGGATRFGYNPDLQATVTRFPGTDSISHRVVEPHRSGILNSPGLTEYYGHDMHGRLTSALVPAVRQLTFAYDSLGHLRRTEFRPAEITCDWDPQTGVQCTSDTPDSTHTFGYDAVGNLTTTVTPGGTTTGTYVAGNRILTFSGCGYTTDSTGNVTVRSACADSTRFWWSPGGRLDSAKVGSRRLRFAYDAGGHLVRRDSATAGAFSTQSYFLWDGDNLVAELNATGAAAVAEYSYYPGGMDNLHALLLPGLQLFYAHTDAMGNVRALATGSGQVRRTYNYDEWGRLLATSGDSLPFSNADRARWKGALWLGPELDVYYMRNRWYEPRTGRFLSEDPIGLSAGINQFVFAEGDPVNGSDPAGLMMDRPSNGGGPGCWSELCQTAWNPASDWDGNGVSDAGAFADYGFAVVVIGAALRRAGINFSQVLPGEVVRAVEWGVRTSNFGIDQVAVEQYVARMMGRGLVTLGTVNETDIQTGQITLNIRFFNQPRGNSLEAILIRVNPIYDYSELRFTLVHELYHHLRVMAGYGPQDYAEAIRTGFASDRRADCFAARHVRYMSPIAPAFLFGCQ